MTPPEFTIIGAGLAGTTLAWALVRRGRAVRLIDREPPVTSSRIAAGLLTPITGKKLSVSWRWGELRPAAERFYRSVEAETGATFFRLRPILRLFVTEAERRQFEEKRVTFGELATAIDSPPEHVAMPFSGFAMPTAAQLDVRGYLDASREWFRKRGVYQYSSAPVAPAGRGELSSTAPATRRCRRSTPSTSDRRRAKYLPSAFRA